jgi:hypothetical protein
MTASKYILDLLEVREAFAEMTFLHSPQGSINIFAKSISTTGQRYHDARPFNETYHLARYNITTAECYDSAL